MVFGGEADRAETNNQAHRAYVAQNPEDEDPPYADVACDVAIQTAKPKTVEVHEGNRECAARCRCRRRSPD
jgi:hypothetical protein